MCAICQLPSNHQIERLIIANYLDPGGGQVIQSIIPALLGFLSTVLASLLFFFRRFIRPVFQKKILLPLFFIVLIVIIIIVIRSRQQEVGRVSDKRVIVLAFDGLEPSILEKGMADDNLPNFKKLKEEGYYSPLETTVPPESPVAWASFATGVWPPKHKIYDFILRNPDNYGLDLTFSVNDKWNVPPFWESLTKHNVPATILFLPNTYPPSKLSGTMIAGMGVPDILGTLGTSTLITTKDYSQKKNWRGKIVQVRNAPRITTALPGPKYKSVNETKEATLPIEIEKNEGTKSLIIKVQDQTINLIEKEFSDWIQLEFKLDFFTNVRGIAKFYAKEVSSDAMELYVSPINIDPQQPHRPISYPPDYAKELVKEYGPFSTIGLPHDTWALDQDVFDEEAFLRNAQETVEERRMIYFGELAKFQSGLFFGYFGMTDTMQHMFWRFLGDEKSSYKNVIMNTYKKADEILGETLSEMRKNDTLIVLSDHGFASFDYEVNLNSWLRDNGYLVLKGNKMEGGELLEDVDWSKTKAYTIGYNGVYFNVKGREKSGILEKGEVEGLTQELSDKLSTLVNPLTSKPLIKKVHTRNELGIDTDDRHAPDLFVGYYKGARSSWGSAVGAVEKDVVKKRESKWSGDHLFDASEVPGVLLVNKKIQYENPRIVDVMPTLLSLFSIPIPEALDGVNILKEAKK